MDTIHKSVYWIQAAIKNQWLSAPSTYIKAIVTADDGFGDLHNEILTKQGSTYLYCQLENTHGRDGIEGAGFVVDISTQIKRHFIIDKSDLKSLSLPKHNGAQRVTADDICCYLNLADAACLRHGSEIASRMKIILNAIKETYNGGLEL